MESSENIDATCGERQCCILCENHDGQIDNEDQVTFYPLPDRENDKDRREIWLDRIQQIKPDISITDKTRLCSLHFEDNICGNDSIPTKVFLEGKEWQSIKIKEEKVDENLNNTEENSFNNDNTEQPSCSTIANNSQIEEKPDTKLSLKEQMNPTSVTAVDESFHKMPNKAYMCSVCGKILVSFSGFRRHNMNHQDKKKWECQICQKTFVEKDHYKGHVSAHHEIGRFVCKKCNKEYAYKASFNRHMKVCKKADKTSTVQEYKCDICSCTFNKKDILSDHVKGKHGGSTGHYPCSVCGKRFRYRASRSKHTKSVHQ